VVGASITAVAEAVLNEAVRLVVETTGITVPIAVIAMGRFGGAELSYASDLDVMVVHDGRDDADAALAERAAAELRRLLNGPTPSEELYPTDFDLRPEGKHGPLARSLAGYEQYYERWAQTWERQALLRGRFVVGDADLGERFAVIARAFLRHELTEHDERGIRRLKARMERERIPPGDDPDFHLKLGRGGLSDVEWTVQLLQLRHQVLGLPGTLAALAALEDAGYVSAGDAGSLRDAYTYCERTRNRLHLVRGTPGDALPARPEQLGHLARSLGTTGPALRDEYRRVTRRSRAVTERLFYGAGGAPRRRGGKV
jgi:[glutamine synthetase] adenylyltransferase / [glutamine synthetase]-adenylyl-L-tyrosine phosphorylase